MVALKSADVEPFVARPRADQPVILLYGPDSGLVRERAQRLIDTSVDDPNDPFALVRIEGDVLASEPSRLVDEAHTVPLFGGRRAVWIKAGSRSFAPAVEAVVASPPTDCRIVIEAGDLKRSAPLRALCEKAKCAVALPCYADDDRALARLVEDEMRAAKLSIEPEARDALVSLIGGDRQASRSEIRKLALYAYGKDRVVLDDVLAVVADASSMALDAVVDAAFTGQAAETETQLSKAFAAGTSGGSILSAALRHVAQLHKARASLDAGEDNFAAMRSFIPPVHFSRKNSVEATLRSWTAARLERAMEQLADATFNARRTAALADALAQRSMLAIAQAGRRKGR
jgi:DNA polymerase-3 subunit delta